MAKVGHTFLLFLAMTYVHGCATNRVLIPNNTIKTQLCSKYVLISFVTLIGAFHSHVLINTHRTSLVLTS